MARHPTLFAIRHCATIQSVSLSSPSLPLHPVLSHAFDIGAYFNSAYINPHVKFDFQNAFLDEPAEDELIMMDIKMVLYKRELQSREAQLQSHFGYKRQSEKWYELY